MRAVFCLNLEEYECRRHQVSRRLYFSLREAEVNFWSPSGAVSWVNWTVFLLLKIFLCGSESPLMRIPWSGSGNWAFNLMTHIYKTTLNHLLRKKNNLICFAKVMWFSVGTFRQLLKVNSAFRQVIGQIGHVKSRLQILSFGLEPGPSGSLLLGWRRNRRRGVGGRLWYDGHFIRLDCQIEIWRLFSVATIIFCLCEFVSFFPRFDPTKSSTAFYWI